MKCLNWQLSEMEIVRYRCGDPGIPVIVEALHAQPPRDDRYTGEIVTRLSENNDISAIIGNVPRDMVDLNRPIGSNCPAEARTDYNNTVAELLKHCGYGNGPFLLLSVHGCVKSTDFDYSFFLGTYRGKSCRPEVRDWLIKRLNDEASGYLGIPNSEIEVSDENPKYTGLSNLEIFPNKYGPDFNTVQLEISQTVREELRPQLIELLAGLVMGFPRKYA